ncbi:hypothetical protein BJ166DRAFT_155666 [Pestalotiopsis sp. NC0098]|nr:hypothetical protein BJ166DRAFT_155666 [Pestalotiopsis sp. NC0098]
MWAFWRLMVNGVSVLAICTPNLGQPKVCIQSLTLVMSHPVPNFVPVGSMQTPLTCRRASRRGTCLRGRRFAVCSKPDQIRASECLLSECLIISALQYILGVAPQTPRLFSGFVSSRGKERPGQRRVRSK